MAEAGCQCEFSDRRRARVTSACCKRSAIEPEVEETMRPYGGLDTIEDSLPGCASDPGEGMRPGIPATSAAGDDEEGHMGHDQEATRWGPSTQWTAS